MGFIGVARIVLAGIAVFFCPGYALLVVLKRQKDLALIEMLCVAGGLSIVVVPLMLYATTYLGIELVPWQVMVALSIAGAICLWDGQRRFSYWRSQRGQRPRETDLVYPLLGMVCTMTLFARIWMVRDIDYPLWTDSYHHTVITQLISDVGKIPSSYRPYAPVDQFTYHFGFHTLSAWFHQLSGVAVPRSVVLTGQLVNTLAVPGSYLLTQRLFGNRPASLISSMVVGLVSHMPAFFVNWGRYTQLSGQVALPVLMVLTMDSLDQATDRTRTILLGGIGATGLFLVHIRVFLFYLLFCGLLFLFRLFSALRQHDSNQVQQLLIRGLALGGVTLVIAAPWLRRFLGGFGSTVAQELTGGYRSGQYGTYFRWRAQDILDYGLRTPLLILAIVGCLLGTVNGEVSTWLLVTWLLTLFGMANLHRVCIVPLFTNLIISKILYLPGVSLIGYLGGELIKLMTNQIRQRRFFARSLRPIAVAGTALICVGGVGYTANLIRPQNGFVRQADLDAMKWIEQSMPEDALFHISACFWTPGVAHGLDAGYWIPFLAGRKTTIPPEIYASDASATYVEFINQRVRDLLEPNTAEQLWQMMIQYDVTHVYIGSRPSNLRADLFLADHARFRPVYSEDDVWVFQVNG